MRLPHNPTSRSSGARFVLWLAMVLVLSFSGGALAHQLKPSKVAQCESDACRPHAVVQVAAVLESKRFALDAPVLLGMLAAAFTLEQPKVQSFLESVSLELPVQTALVHAESSPRAPPATFE